MMDYPIRGILFSIALSAACLAGLAPAAGQEVNEEIRERIERHRLSGRLVIAGTDIAARELLWELYEDAAYGALWTDSNADNLIDLVGRAEEEGLLPRDYHHRELLELSGGDTWQPAQAADRDILLTESLLRYMYHLTFGKVDPSALDSNWNLTRRLDRDPSELVVGAIASQDIRTFIGDALDLNPYYERMKALLAEYRERAAREGGGYAAVPAGPTLRKDMRSTRVALLRSRLRASGHLTANTRDPELFDADLERAVIRFQEEAGIDVDGAVGAGTLAALNVSLQSRIDQIRVNMERSRWILRDVRDSEDFVLVNIADFKAMLFRDRRQVWETRAQVGRTYRKSPVFRADMKYVQFNPTWTVPPGILRRDILPRLKADAEGYLAAQNMKLVDSATGQEVDPTRIDWPNMSARTFRYQVVQRPGPNNALGLAKFIFPNPHYVFLHDTNHREHFDADVRTFSSGCIRIEHPMEFARLVLDDADWNDQAIQRVLNSKQTRTVFLNEPLPVMILYWTVDPVTDDGKPRFLADVYDRDDAVLAALEEPFRFVLPDDMPAWLDEDAR